MKRFIFIILTFFLIFINISANADTGVMTKELKVQSIDNFSIVATLSYPKIKNKKEFSTVVLLHSLGYNSAWWGDLPKMFLDNGYAVLSIDLRGHGKSIYNAKLTKTSWKNMKDSAFVKYPDDILAVMKNVKDENVKKEFFNNWVIVGSDIGASAGIIAADRFPTKPKTIVMMSPIVKSKGLYIPVSIAQLDDVDFLSIIGTNDAASLKASHYLKKFAQKDYFELTSESHSYGMIMFKNDKGLEKTIEEWVKQYLN